MITSMFGVEHVSIIAAIGVLLVLCGMLRVRVTRREPDLGNEACRSSNAVGAGSWRAHLWLTVTAVFAGRSHIDAVEIALRALQA